VTPSRAEIAAVRHALAALSEGYCPRCRGRLDPLTVRQVVATAQWPHPPSAWCPTCRGVVGRYSGSEQGVYLAHGGGRTDVTP
jgi:hypothetical protein